MAKPISDGQTYVFIIALCILILLLLFAVTLAAYYFKRSNDCQTDPNIWCWTDWQCPYSTGWVGVTGVYAVTNPCQVPGSTGCSCVYAGIEGFNNPNCVS